MEEILKMSLEILMKAEKEKDQTIPNPESTILSLVDKVMTQKNMNIK